MPLPVQHDLVASLTGGPGLVSLDPHVPIETSTLDEWRPVLARADVLWLGREELELGREDDPLPTLRSLAGGRLRFILWKRGAAGGWLYDAAADRLLAWAPRTAAGRGSHRRRRCVRGRLPLRDPARRIAGAGA